MKQFQFLPFLSCEYQHFKNFYILSSTLNLRRQFSLSMTLMRNYYDLLGVPRTATSAEIKAKYFELCKKYHPDKNQSNHLKQGEFVKINEAYSTLSNASKRREYDNKLSNSGRTWNHYNRPKASYQPYRETGKRHSDDYYEQRGMYWKNQSQRQRYAYDESTERLQRDWEAKKAFWGSNMNQSPYNQKYNYWNDHYANREKWRNMSSDEQKNVKNIKRFFNYTLSFFVVFYILAIVRPVFKRIKNREKNMYRENDENQCHSTQIKSNIEFVKQRLAEEKVSKNDFNIVNDTKNLSTDGS